MRLLLSLSVVGSLLLSSCVFYRGGPAPTLAGLGMDARKITLPDGATFEDINTSNAFNEALKQVKSMWASYLLQNGLQYLAGKYYSQQGRLVNADTTVKLEQLRNAREVSAAKASLEELKVTTAAQ